MANQGAALLRAQNLQLGSEFTRVTGLAKEGVTVTPMGDSGAITTGVQGDYMFEVLAVTGYTMNVNVLRTATQAIDLILTLRDTVGVFPCKFELGQANIQGFAVVQNEGVLDGSEGNNTRTFVLAFGKDIGLLGSVASA